MKKLLIGSLVLLGLLIPIGSDAIAQPPVPPPTPEARITALETRLGGIETTMAQLNEILRRPGGLAPLPPPPPPPPLASLSATLEEFLADQRKAQSQRELADALKCLLSKSTPSAYPWGYTTPSYTTPSYTTPSYTTPSYTTPSYTTPSSAAPYCPPVYYPPVYCPPTCPPLNWPWQR